MLRRSALLESRVLAGCEIAFVVVVVLIAEWVLLPLFGKRWEIFVVPIATVLAFGLCSHLVRRERAVVLGLRLDNFLAAWRFLLPPMFLGTILLAGIGVLAGSLGAGRSRAGWQFLGNTPWLLLWGFLQQYALQAVINQRAQLIWEKGTISVTVVALIFAALHLPNIPLVLATFIGGSVWSAAYQRTPNLYALAISHCIMTIILVWALPPAALHRLRVGIGYFY